MQFKVQLNNLSWIAYHNLYLTHQIITKVIFALSSFFSALEFLSLNHMSLYKNSETLTRMSLKIQTFLMKCLKIDQIIYLEQMHARHLNIVDIIIVENITID